ncbi:MAG TPA: hypothetical protein PLH72_19500, partial [Vicinamibacterales bacterium]|nr:hypothetical protein [Vicinamibacterales bacterium]
GVSMQAEPATPVLSLRGIDKIFPGVRALDGVRIDLYPGQVTALIGENGAGIRYRTRRPSAHAARRLR